MYGHNNRIAESYKLYNEVLTENPAYYHAWKGVAWIAYSHDKNTSLAKLILLWLQEKHPVPDYDLMLSEIAAYEQDNNLKNQHIASFIDKAVSLAYGDMYNKYIFSILSDDLNDHSKAMSIAKKELAKLICDESTSAVADIQAIICMAKLFTKCCWNIFNQT